MRIEKYLDAVIERHDLKNDTGLAEMLGINKSAVSHYRTGRRTMDNETCLRIAQALDMADPLPVIMSADMDRAERAGQHSLWEVFSRRMAQAAAPATLAVLVASATNFVSAPSSQASTDANSRLEHRLLCQIRRRWSMMLEQCLRAIQTGPETTLA